MEQNTKILIALSSFIILFLAIVGFYFYYMSINIDSVSVDTSVVRDGDLTNVDDTSAGKVAELYTSDKNFKFKEGLDAERDGDHERAFSLFAEALEGASSKEDRANIEYRMARVSEQFNVTQSIALFKEVIANEAYPDIQKSYAAMWLPLLITRSSDNVVRNEVFKNEPYLSFRDSNPATELKNLYEYSLTFGSNGVADVYVAGWLAKQLTEDVSLTNIEKDAMRIRIKTLLAAGDAYIEANKNDFNNKGLIPRIMRERARAYGSLALSGDVEALSKYDSQYEIAIQNGILSKLDGAIRLDYVAIVFSIEGESGFSKTQKHLDILLSNIDEYPGIEKYFVVERNDFYGTKDKLIALANANKSLKTYLIKSAGWSPEAF